MHRFVSKNKPLTIAAIIMLLIPFCRKIDSNKNNIAKWDVHEAKEWWYGVFRKLPAYAETDFTSPYAIYFKQASGNYEPGSTMKLKKYPVWNMGASFKTGRFETAEFPLIYPVRVAPMPEADSLDEQQKKKIAECMLNRVLMIKTAYTTEVRIATIIPRYDYASSRKFDISNNSMHGLDKDFRGWIIIRKWNEQIVNIYEIENGKKVRKLNLQPIQPGSRTNNECGYTSVEVWHKVCFEGPCVPQQDVPCINSCADWYYILETEWQWTCTSSEDVDCSQNSLPYEQCMCYYYGLDCYDDGDDNEQIGTGNTPCAIADSLENDLGLVTYRVTLEHAVSGNKERMFILNYEDDVYKYIVDTSGIADSLGAPDFQLPAGFKCDGIMHNHFDVDRALNIFSASDLLTLGNFFINDAIKDVKTFILL